MELQLVTNGLLVTPEVRRRFQTLDPQTVGVSIDGATPESYRAAGKPVWAVGLSFVGKTRQFKGSVAERCGRTLSAVSCAMDAPAPLSARSWRCPWLRVLARGG